MNRYCGILYVVSEASIIHITFNWFLKGDLLDRKKVLLSHRMSQNEIRNLQNAKPNFASYPEGITFVSSASERV